MKTSGVTRRQIEKLLGVAATGPECVIDHVCACSGAGPASLVFAVDAGVLDAAIQSGAGLILAQTEYDDHRVVRVKNARTAFAQVYAAFFDERGGSGVHPSAVVAEGVILGRNCAIAAGCVLEDGVVLGADCVLGPRVTIHAGTNLGARVRVQSGAVLGSDGFGYVRLPEGYVGFPQIGTLWIGDDVEIGANTTIDRGALGETRIGRGTKIDNLVHIAHNCVIGEDVMIAAQVGMAGSTTIGDNAMLGGQVGLGERVTIADGVILGGQGGVLPGKTLEGKGEVFWGTPARPVREYLRDLARMRRR